jgi:dTDP-4-dehydrorhamnose 3,5-epimerase-like enzyme
MRIINGNSFIDERGVVRYINNFDLSSIVRMYCIEPSLGVIRAWHGHKVEKKWFYAAKGRFLVKLVDMNSYNKMDFELTSVESNILEIGGGYYNGFQALEEGSVLLVFSNFSLDESKNDDFRETLENIKW